MAGKNVIIDVRKRKERKRRRYERMKEMERTWMDYKKRRRIKEQKECNDKYKEEEAEQRSRD